MANALYPLWKEAALQASANAALNGSGSTGVYVGLCDTGTYTYSAADQYYNPAISGAGKIVGTPQEVAATKTYTNGTFASSVGLTYTAVSGASVEALVFYIQNAGANTTWRMLLFLDTGITGMPVTPNGGNITVAWNASGIFTL